jgi:diguanylate cyclase (GGDEF)-like protein
MMSRYDPAELIAVCPVPILIVDSQSSVVFASEPAMALWPDETLIGADLKELLTIDGGDWMRASVGHVGQPGGRRHFDVQSTPIGSNGDRLLTLHDVSAHVRSLARLKRIAITDPLTGLSNRRGFDRALHVEQRRMDRDGKSLSLLAIDINGLKVRNDTHGHAAGDLWLREVAAALSSSVRRPGDLPARLGGDEFAIILPDTDLRGARVVADRIHARLREPEGDSPRPSVAIGIATAVSGELPGQHGSLLDAADADLYRAKHAKRSPT